jgi:hypothetical protein
LVIVVVIVEVAIDGGYLGDGRDDLEADGGGWGQFWGATYGVEGAGKEGGRRDWSAEDSIYGKEVSVEDDE